MHGQLNPHSFSGTAPRVRVGEHSRRVRGDKGQEPCPAGPDAARAQLTPGRGAPAAPAPAAEGPACPRAAPPPPAFVPAGGQRRSLQKFWAKNPPFCCQPSPTSGAAVRRAGLRTRPPHKGSSSAPSAPQVSAAPHTHTALGVGPQRDGRPGRGERPPPITSPGRRQSSRLRAPRSGKGLCRGGE